MTSLRNFVLKRTLLFVFIFFAAVSAFTFFSTMKVRDVYHNNLKHLTFLLQRNFTFLFDLYSDDSVLKYQLAEAVKKIPNLQAIYIKYGGRELFYPKGAIEEVKRYCSSSDGREVFEVDDSIVVCLPVKEEYASIFMEAQVKGKFVAIYTKRQEEEFVAGWLGGNLVLFFLVVGFGFLLIISIWEGVRVNFSTLEKLIWEVEGTLSKGFITEEERERIWRLIRRFTIREFRRVGSLLISLMERVNELNERVRELAITDSLTGLFNRNYMKIFVEDKLLPNWSRSKRPFAVAILDIDNFKWINDTFGHQTGDRILEAWADVIKSSLRKGDIPIRYGGEEVLIIFPDATKEEAAVALERIRERFSSLDFGIGQRVTFSAGVADYPGDVEEFDSLDELIKIADERLYRAKREGKNRVVIE